MNILYSLNADAQGLEDILSIEQIKEVSIKLSEKDIQFDKVEDSLNPKLSKYNIRCISLPDKKAFIENKNMFSTLDKIAKYLQGVAERSWSNTYITLYKKHTVEELKSIGIFDRIVHDLSVIAKQYPNVFFCIEDSHYEYSYDVKRYDDTFDFLDYMNMKNVVAGLSVKEVQLLYNLCKVNEDTFRGTLPSVRYFLNLYGKRVGILHVSKLVNSEEVSSGYKMTNNADINYSYMVLSILSSYDVNCPIVVDSYDVKDQLSTKECLLQVEETLHKN